MGAKVFVYVIYLYIFGTCFRHDKFYNKIMKIQDIDLSLSWYLGPIMFTIVLNVYRTKYQEGQVAHNY